MSTFHKSSDRLGLYANKILKYLVIGIVLLGITYFLLAILQNTLDQDFISLDLLIFSEINTYILNIIVLLFLGIFATLNLKFLYNRNKILMKIISLFQIFLIIFIAGSLFFAGQNILSTLYLLGAFFSELLSSVSNLLPFFVVLPFIVLFYFKKLRIPAKYKLKNLSFRNNALIVDDGKARKFKGLSILEITNIPKNIVIKEDRPQKKAIEKLVIPGDIHYLHYHLTSLAKAMPELAFEIRVEKNDIRLRFIITATGIEINEVMNEIEVQRNILESILQTTFPGLKFQLLQGNLLKTGWEEIFGGWGSYKMKFTEKNKIEINKIAEKTYLSILKCEDVPDFKIINNASQIDSMIRGLLGSHLNLNYVVVGTPIEIHDFEKQKKGIESEAKNFTREVYDKFDKKKKEFKKTYKPLKWDLEEEEIRTELANLRHAEITGMWKVSSYISIRSNDKNQHNNDIQRVKALFSTIFGSDLRILESTTLERCFHKIFMRSLLDEPLILTSEQLAIFLHLPENPIPSLSRVDIPDFEIPPENKVRDGISIGKILYYDQEMYPLRLTLDELRLNAFICGLIGMGKSRCGMNIMRQLAENHPDINWVCLDWKGEYKFLVNEVKSQKIVVLIPGSDIMPVHLNMFDPQKSNSDEHARKLFAIIREVFKSEFTRETELSAQMETVCKEVLRTVIKNPRMRNLNSFIEELKNYGKEKSAENKTIMMTINALINRFDRFRHGILKNVLDVKKSNVNFDNLMGEKVVFDLNYLISKGGAKEDARLLMNIILKYIIDKALERGIADSLKHIVLVEDSQLLVPSVLREVPETSLVEDIPLLLRGVGESLITIATRPEISADILANSGIKISFKSPYDSEKIAHYQNLTENQEKYLRIMPKREAIVNLPNFQFPFRIVTDYFDYEKITEEDILAKTILSSDIYEREHQISIQENNGAYQSINELKFSSENKSAPKITAISQDSDSKKLDRKNTAESTVTLAKLHEILKSKPLNKKGLSEKLGIPREELDEILKSFIDKNQIISFLAPVFNKKTKQKLFSLPGPKNFVREEIQTRLENDFLRNGKIGKLSEVDSFDYIWYGSNFFIKILNLVESPIDISEIENTLLKWFEEAIERGSYELLIIIPFYDVAESIRNWLNGNQILIFSYYIEDWNKLRDYFDKGIIPDWNIKENCKSERVLTDNLKDTFSFEQDEIKRNQGFNSNLKNSDSLKNSEMERYPKEIIKINSIPKEELQKQWILNIQSKSPDKLSFQTLERFNKNYPSINELAEELGCTIYNTEKELKGLMPFLKSVEIHDLYESLNLKQRYFGWKNENLGQNLMELELIKLFDGKKIEFQKIKMRNDIRSLVINGNFLIYSIFDESDLQKFLQIIEPENILNKFIKIALVIHTIELKYHVENKLKDTPLVQKIEVYLYDWSSLGPMVRSLALKPSGI